MFNKPILNISRSSIAVALLLVWQTPVQATAVTLLDNTATGTATLAGNQSSLSGFRKAVVFTSTTTPYHLDTLTLGLRAGTSSGSYSFDVALYNVDGSNNPTGSPLVSETFTETLTTTAAYLALDLTGFDVAASSKYALVLQNGTAGANWVVPSPNLAPTGSNGFSYVDFRSFNGSIWTSTSFFNTFWLEGSPNSVPEMDAAAAGGALTLLAGALALSDARRRRTA